MRRIFLNALSTSASAQGALYFSNISSSREPPFMPILMGIPLPLQLSPPLPAGRWNRYCRVLRRASAPASIGYGKPVIKMYICNKGYRDAFLYPPGRKPPSCPAPPPYYVAAFSFQFQYLPHRSLYIGCFVLVMDWMVMGLPPPTGVFPINIFLVFFPCKTLSVLE